MSDGVTFVYRNVWSGAIFIVRGEPAAQRMAALTSWVRR